MMCLQQPGSHNESYHHHANREIAREATRQRTQYRALQTLHKADISESGLRASFQLPCRQTRAPYKRYKRQIRMSREPQPASLVKRQPFDPTHLCSGYKVASKLPFVPTTQRIDVQMLAEYLDHTVLWITDKTAPDSLGKRRCQRRRLDQQDCIFADCHTDQFLENGNRELLLQWRFQRLTESQCSCTFLMRDPWQTAALVHSSQPSSFPVLPLVLEL
mmetsp:Transcript_16392/g.28692  ORF Transcript_16392/g.28692 Transcript_16392/m.28692 type:complete len:218 (-) Transcript_16392:295-948(-)